MAITQDEITRQVEEIQRKGAELTVFVDGKTEVIETHDIPEKDAKELRNNIKETWKQTGLAYLRFGGLVHKMLSSTVNSTHMFNHWGYNDFKDYCKRELGMEVRQAYYMREAWQNVDRGLLPESVIDDIGIAKTKELSNLARRKLLTAETKDKWMETAKTKSWDEFKGIVRDEKIKAKVERREKQAAGIKLPDEEMNQFQAYMPDSVYVLWQSAMTRAENLLRKHPNDSISSSQKLNCIALDFLASHLDKREDALGAILRRIEAFYDVRVFCLDPNDKAKYGEDFAKALEKAMADHKTAQEVNTVQTQPTQTTSSNTNS